MKPLVCLLICSGFGALADAETIPTDRPDLPKLLADPLPGDQGWSKRVNGLQARFSIDSVRNSEGSWSPRVQIEFHNSRNGSPPITFDLSVYNDLRLQLRTKDGTPAPKPSVSGPRTYNYQVSIPSGGTLKFPINQRQPGSSKDYRLILDFGKSVWHIQNDDNQVYFLTATLTVPPLPIGKKPNAYRYWSGELKIPPVPVASSKMR
jgi:hypothetical protein